MDQIQTLMDEGGEVTTAVVLVVARREIASEIETHHLLRSPTIRDQVLAALEPQGAAARLKERLGGERG